MVAGPVCNTVSVSSISMHRAGKRLREQLAHPADEMRVEQLPRRYVDRYACVRPCAAVPEGAVLIAGPAPSR